MKATFFGLGSAFPSTDFPGGLVLSPSRGACRRLHGEPLLWSGGTTFWYECGLVSPLAPRSAACRQCRSLWEVFVSGTILRCRVLCGSRLSDAGVAGAERRVEIVGFLRAFSGT